MGKISITGMSGRKLLWGEMLLHSESRRKTRWPPASSSGLFYACCHSCDCHIYSCDKAVSVWKQRLPVMDCPPEAVVLLKCHLYGILLLRVNFAVHGRERGMLLGILLRTRELWVHRHCGAQIQLWVRLILAVLLLPGQVSTAGFVPCHHVANILSIRFQLIRKWKNLTGHLAKQKESI